MIPYFQGGYDEAKLYISGSAKRIIPICPDCGRVKEKSLAIVNIKENHGIGCPCRKSNSYPNKFIYCILKQLKVEFESEKVFQWAKFARYDFYFKINNIDYVIEADGGIGHGNSTFKHTDFSKIESMYLDYRKDSIAEKYNVNMIRIDCFKSEKEYIKQNILASELNKIFDLTNIDWDLCNKFATSNIVKDVCEKYVNGATVHCLAEEYKVSKDTIRNYLHRGTELNWCFYNGRENILKVARTNGFKNAKPILVFDADKNFICEVKSITYLEMNSMDILGVTITAATIIKSCKNNCLCKGFYFKYKSDISEDDFSEIMGDIN